MEPVGRPSTVAPAGRVVLADEAFDHQRQMAGRVAAAGEDDRRDLGVRNVMGRHGEISVRMPSSAAPRAVGATAALDPVGEAHTLIRVRSSTYEVQRKTANPHAGKEQNHAHPDHQRREPHRARPADDRAAAGTPRPRPAARRRRGQRRRRAAGPPRRDAAGRRRPRRGRHPRRRRRAGRDPRRQTARRRQIPLPKPAHHRHRQVRRLRDHESDASRPAAAR